MASTSKAKQNHKRKLLSSSRPGGPSAQNKRTVTVSSRLTRTVIRSYHNLQKKLQQAKVTGDGDLTASLQARIDKSGGLDAYQRASIQGQAADRGGDSSRVLIEWLKDAKSQNLTAGSFTETSPNPPGSTPTLRLLEVGALRPDNACSRSGMFQITRIDLHSQHPSIEEQDFMARPVPKDRAERATQGFDVVSLSLVVNYVGDAVGRGLMLKRVSSFLREPGTVAIGRAGEQLNRWFPGLFLVLPAPCVTNSRYLNEEKLENIMGSLGFDLLVSKIGNKLVYHYFRFDCKRRDAAGCRFGKSELRKGGTRNNFAVVL
ncbi:MAG: hypothetical protein LQ340_003220 [Diploschistes diacapsis]|nr:MAG: hypothetical protein LQ340_003220 [Diploschistes diacapsis]